MLPPRKLFSSGLSLPWRSGDLCADLLCLFRGVVVPPTVQLLVLYKNVRCSPVVSTKGTAPIEWNVLMLSFVFVILRATRSRGGVGLGAVGVVGGLCVTAVSIHTAPYEFGW